MVFAEAVRRRRGALLSIAIALALVGGGAAAVEVRHDDAAPSKWNRRLAPLAEFVEDERGLRFDHAVPVEFLDGEEFERSIAESAAELTDEERSEIEDTGDVLRALGLLGTDVDLFDTVTALEGEGTLAYYDDDAERIRVRGTRMTPQVRSTLVHELTHALQDQHFDLGRLEELEAEGQGSVFLGLIEGDANRIATAYEQTLRRADREAIEKQNQADADELDLERFPASIAALFVLPYVLGEPLASILVETGGQRAIDDALRDPPLGDEALLDPLTFVEGDRAEKVDVPAVPEGLKAIDDGEVGAFGWYLLLAQRLDPKRALAAADGWGGDRYVAFRRDDRVCVRVAYRGETSRDADDLAAALREWARPTASSVEVTRGNGRAVSLESCEPDEGTAPELTVSVQDLLTLPATRAQTQLAVLLEDDDQVDFAHCFADGLVQALTIEQLQADDLDDAVSASIRRLALSCRSSSD